MKKFEVGRVYYTDTHHYVEIKKVTEHSVVYTYLLETYRAKKRLGTFYGVPTEYFQIEWEYGTKVLASKVSKDFDIYETDVVYTQIGDTIYARSATAADYQKKGTDYLEEKFGRPAVKTGRHTWEVDGESYVCRSGRMGDEYHGTWESADGKKRGGMEYLYNICLRQMERLPRERQLLEYPIFPDADLQIYAMYALAVWTVAVRKLRHGATYPQDALDLAEKAAKGAAVELDTKAPPRPKFPIPLQSGWYVALDDDTFAERKIYITRDGDTVYADAARPAPISRGEKEEYAYVRSAGKLWRVSSLSPWD